MEMVLYAGLVNWLATLIFVDSEVFREFRELVDRRAPAKLRYLVHCPLCAGTWIALIMALFVVGPFHIGVGPLDWLLNGLLFKAVGHLTLEVAAILKHHNALLDRAEKEGIYHGAGHHNPGNGAQRGASDPVGSDGHAKGRILAD